MSSLTVWENQGEGERERGYFYYMVGKGGSSRRKLEW